MLTPQDIFQFLTYATIAAALAGLLILLIITWTVVYHVSQPGKRLRNNLIATPLTLLAAFTWAYIASSDTAHASGKCRQKPKRDKKNIWKAKPSLRSAAKAPVRKSIRRWRMWKGLPY